MRSLVHTRLNATNWAGNPDAGLPLPKPLALSAAGYRRNSPVTATRGSPASHGRAHRAAWDARLLRPHLGLSIACPAYNGAGTDGGLVNGATDGSNGSEAQPRPHAKRQRLTSPAADGPSTAQQQPRRPPQHQALDRRQDPQRREQGQVSAPPGRSGRGGRAGRGSGRGQDGGGRGRGQGGRGQQQQQRPPAWAQRGYPGSATAAISSGQATSERNIMPARRVEDFGDDDDEEEDEEDGELLALSEEELERMVFASAAASNSGGGGGGGASGGGGATADASASESGQCKAGAAAPPPTAATTPAAAIAAAGLPAELAELLLAAHESGDIGEDSNGDVLAQQLNSLLAEAAKVVTAPATPAAPASPSAPASPDPEGAAAGAASVSGSGSVEAGLGVLAGVHRVADYLGCEPKVAAVILVNFPRLLALPVEEAEGRLRSLAFQLGSDFVEAQRTVARNPALLLVKKEPLERKLKALANATGLSMAQAAGMITAYMFPELGM